MSIFYLFLRNNRDNDKNKLIEDVCIQKRISHNILRKN